MHHFLGRAGRAGSRPTCRRPIRPQRRGVPRRRSKGSRGVKHHARSAGGSTTQAVPHTHPRPKAHPVPSRPHPPGWRLSKPATASPMGRRPKSPNQWRGHGVESLGGRRPQQAGTPIRPRRAVSPSDPRDVVPRDEGTRVSGERSTTPNLPAPHPTLETWCPATKEQGFAWSEAPRPTCRRPTYAPHPARLQLQGR